MSNTAPNPKNDGRTIVLATRGSALAMVQTNLVLGLCRTAFPGLSFEARIIKTTGDKLQTAPPDVPGMAGTKGLFTKELEVALLNGEADFAVHSLKDLPTELPEGLELSAVLPRADVRDVLIYRDVAVFSQAPGASGEPVKRALKPGAAIQDFPAEALIATSSTRRQAQLLALRPDFKVEPIRGNVGTRLQKLADRPELDGIVLAAAGLERLRFRIGANGSISAEASASGEPGKVQQGLIGKFLSVEEMVPCVGQGAIAIEGRKGDQRLQAIFAHLNHVPTLQCVTAERAFLHGMGGGCLSPVAAYADIVGEQLRLRAVSFRQEKVRRTERIGAPATAAELGADAAAELL